MKTVNSTQSKFSHTECRIMISMLITIIVVGAITMFGIVKNLDSQVSKKNDTIESMKAYKDSVLSQPRDMRECSLIEKVDSVSKELNMLEKRVNVMGKRQDSFDNEMNEIFN